MRHEDDHEESHSTGMEGRDTNRPDREATPHAPTPTGHGKGTPDGGVENDGRRHQEGDGAMTPEQYWRSLKRSFNPDFIKAAKVEYERRKRLAT